MRVVTGFAALDAHGGMLEQKRPALFGVALEARLFVGERLLNHSRPRGHSPVGGERSVRIVAVGARHEPLVDAMFEGHGELRADRGMAGVTETGLLRSQQEF